MPIAQGTIGASAIYNGSNKIGKIYKGTELYYQSYVYNPVVALIERTIEKVDTELTNEITTIGTSAFSNSTNLTNIVLPNTIISINISSFYNCSSLTNITIPESVTTIGQNSFEGCSKLTNMTILATTPPILGLNAISESTTTIYVPASSLQSYQAASGWSDLMTRETNPVAFVGI